MKVVQVIDSLAPGGAERVAVNIANELARRGHLSYLCTTRATGLLREALDDDVCHIHMARRGRFDLRAIKTLRSFLKKVRPDLVHAHSSSVFVAAAAAPRSVPILWHDHFGALTTRGREPRPYRLVRRRISVVVAVSDELRRWAIEQLRIPAEDCFTVPNFVARDDVVGQVRVGGKPGHRIVCVANMRPQKDHITLVSAMEIVLRRVPSAHLLCVGAPVDPAYARRVEEEVTVRHLDAHIELLGERADVPSILASCDIGVLSSASEGSPVSLPEYAAAGLAVVATDVGQVREMLGSGQHGLLVPAADPSALAEAHVQLLTDPRLRCGLGEGFREASAHSYSSDEVMDRITGIYEHIRT